MNSFLANSPHHHIQELKSQLVQLIDLLRPNVGEVVDQKVQALFKTFAEVITGMVKAIDDFEKKSEEAWRS